MPIMALFRSSDIDRPRYDAIIQELDLEHRPAEGMLTHVCGFDSKGICVTDVWESRQDFAAFVSARLRPAFAKLNLPFTAPEILEAYDFEASDGVNHYIAKRGAGFGAERETGASGGRTPTTPH